MKLLACLAFVVVAAACATPSNSSTQAPTTATPIASAPSTAAVPPTLEEQEWQAARAGCIHGITEPNIRTYAARAAASGVAADAALAEARFVMTSAEGVFGDVCDCTFNALGGWSAITRDSAAAGVALEVWVREQLATPAVQAKGTPCAERAIANLEPVMKKMKPAVEAFRASQAAAAPTSGATPVPAPTPAP
jgi:hypothetical protein